MSPSEIAFLALGLVLGAAIGAALIEVARARPGPRREVRITVSPNSIAPRRSVTLATAERVDGQVPIPGSPDEEGWLERRLAGEPSPAQIRTRVPSGPVTVPTTAVAVPVAARTPTGVFSLSPSVTRNDPGPDAGPATAARPGATRAAGAVLDRVTSPVARPVVDERPAGPSPASLPATLDVGRPDPQAVVRPRPPVPVTRPSLPPRVVAVRIDGHAPVIPLPPAPPAPLGAPVQAPVGAPPQAPVGAPPQAPVGPAATSPDRPAARDGSGDLPADGSAAAASPSAAPSCESERTLVQERCALADAARTQARIAADALRDARRAYDVLRERVEHAQSVADPREIRAAKDALHRAFRAARAAATSTDAAEQAARDWLSEVNRLNTAAREAVHVIETGGAELRAQLPQLERLAVEADAARITSEGAEVGCRDAREALARCEEQAAISAAAAAEARRPAPEEPIARDLAWPTEPEAPLLGTSEPPADGMADAAAVIRILRGDRAAREHVVAVLAAGNPEAGRLWHIRLAELVDAIGARAIEDGYLDLPDDGFWGLFAHRERREIVSALSALGFRFDGLGGFADGRVPAPRDLSLAVGYAGLDRMRIRIWPHESDLAALYAGALVAADEWLAVEAGDLSLGRMVDALGNRAAELAEVWNAWGRVRPLLLATD